MRQTLAILRRELLAYFVSPLAYTLLFCLLLVNGIIFAIILSWLNDPRNSGGRPFDIFFMASWWMVIFVGPLLTMRLLSEERRSGSIEVLMTAPVSETQVVLGKYFAALTFYATLWAPTVLYAVMLSIYTEIDWGIIASGYLGILLIGALLLAMGMFASAMTRNQLIAAVVGVALSFGLYIGSLFEDVVNSEQARAVFGHVSIPRHLEEFARGIVDTQRLVFYLSLSAFFIFLTSRALAARKWR